MRAGVGRSSLQQFFNVLAGRNRQLADIQLEQASSDSVHRVDFDALS